jgi:hypothetical protein
MSEELDPTRVMRIIDHPLRMKIIELLATKGPMSWKDLSKELGTGTGSLYHHLDTLEKIVTRDDSKRYALTPVGKQVYRQVTTVAARDSALHSQLGRPWHDSASVVSGVVAPRSLLLAMTSGAARSIAGLVVISAIVLVATAYSGVELIIFAFSSSPNLFVTGGSYLGSLLFVTCVSYIASWLLFNQKPEFLTLLSSSTLSFLPVAGLSVVLSYMQGTGTLGVLADRTPLTILLAVVQGWSALLLSSGASVASGLRIEKTLIIGLALLYISMSVLFVLGAV